MQAFVRPKIFEISSGKVASLKWYQTFTSNHVNGNSLPHFRSNCVIGCSGFTWKLQMHEIHVLHQLIAINWNKKVN